jgi:hypothetical protein
MALDEFHGKTAIAIPYAGITQVRFKGYFLSPDRHPLLLRLISYRKLPFKSTPNLS